MNEQSMTKTEKAPLMAGDRGLQLCSLDDYWRLAQYVAASGLAPKGIDKPESILVAMQMGAEVGLSPLASLQNIAVINGKPGLFGDAQLAVVRATGELRAFAEWYELDGKRVNGSQQSFPDSFAAVCSVERMGEQPSVSAFSVIDAKRAGLWGKPGPWTQYPTRMLRFRARSFALRDTFGDALKGMRTREELLDDGAIDIEASADKPQLRPNAPAVFAETKSEQLDEKIETAIQPKTAPPTAQDDLKAIVEGAGYTISQFAEWGIASGQIEGNSIESWASIPDDVARRCCRAKTGLLRGISQLSQGGAK